MLRAVLNLISLKPLSQPPTPNTPPSVLLHLAIWTPRLIQTLPTDPLPQLLVPGLRQPYASILKS